MSHDISIIDVADFLGLERDPRSSANAVSVSYKCPFCGKADSRRYTLNVNALKNVFFCPRCMNPVQDKHTGFLDLYARVKLGTTCVPGSNSKQLYGMLKDDMRGSGALKEYSYSKPAYDGPRKIVPASDEVLDAAYSALISLPALALSQQHKLNLLKRGMDEQSIINGGYCSFPPEKKLIAQYDPDNRFKKWYDEHKIAQSANRQIRDMRPTQLHAGYIIAKFLREKGVDVLHVPGFFKISGNLYAFRYEEGMLVPTRNTSGQIVGCQIRRDSNKSQLRYMTVSSKDFPEGPNSNIARFHFTKSKEITEHTTVLVTEGPLKADVALSLMKQMKPNVDVAIIAIQGVNSVSGVTDCVKWLVNECHVKHFYNVLDMDRYCNPFVGKAAKNINQMFRDAGAEIRDLTWDKKFAKEYSKKMAEYLKKAGYEFTLTGNPYLDLSEMSSIMYKKTLPNIAGYEEMVRGNRYYPYWSGMSKGIDDVLLSKALACGIQKF